MKMIVLSIVAILGLFACQTIKPYEIQATFYEIDFEIAEQRGYNTIVGQAFMRQLGGGVVTAAGQEVMLVPVNPYTIEMGYAIEHGLSRAGWVNLDRRYRRYRKSTTADASGNFEFQNVPDGEWYIATKVTWGTGRYSFAEQGGALITKVSVYSGETAKVIMHK